MMKKILFYVALCCFVAGGLAAWAQPVDSQLAPKDMQLFLLIGQSNMAGRGKIGPRDQEIHPRIFMLTQKLEWVPAKDPVHFDKPGMAGVGLCSEFARVLVKKDPKIVVGLIPCAFGGTTIAQWMPGDKPNSLYNTAIMRAKAGMKSGTLAGILWHQGESDAGNPKSVETYNQCFATMIAQMRKDLNAKNVPVLVGELGDGGGHSSKVPFNKVIHSIPDTVPYSAWVSAEGCPTDGLHFKTESLYAFGTKYAEKYLEMKAGRGAKAK